jgi:Uma2 family endonuclease
MPSSTSNLDTPLVPPLENGDKLTCHEFAQRLEAMPANTQAERIEGIVYIPAALRFRSHGRPHALVMAWLSDYWLATAGVELADNTTVRLDLDNDPQPNACLFIDEDYGGRVHVTEDDYLEGSPELIVEVAASSAAIDLHGKKQAYRRNGVDEYLVWQVLDRKVNWYRLQDGAYVEMSPSADGILKSRVFPGLWLAVEPWLAQNGRQIMQVLDQGLRSPEYLNFQQELSSRVL